ncbi:cupin domain-containing protein [Sporosarcina sp. PTS2304]|uniref:cupin domain-containing protein n=1 Tax=Sporosarcina sp. PTS2304 TaxID=2283194 RepID=UPI000E0D60CA|nr:cupin domain-containing protein [Sporosarcina sp. PTS2304]AXI00194.1 cupin domain-containing protein [Sporosarcina sp. PTS2304]
MIKRVKETSCLENLHQGCGRVHIQKNLTEEDQVEGLALFATVIVEPHASIGYHLHTKDAEAYYILRGEGIFLNHLEERVPVKAGDLCLITKGQSHGLENPHDMEIELIAIVY